MTVPFTHAAVRLLAAAGAGALLGLEREIRGRPAGLRTTMLVCFSAAAVLLFVQGMTGGDSAATSRVTQGVVTGIGFLGAGVITRRGTLVHGLTTAAVIWIATILGLTFGAGLWDYGAFGVAVTLLILISLRRCEGWLTREWHGTFTITVQMSGVTDVEIRQRLEAAKVKVKNVCLQYDFEAKQRTLRCDIKHGRKHLFDVTEKVLADRTPARGVISVRWDHE
jgi:putative Mg2+ transporter-C (MgtC) family protein